jgi:hypothetical protein
MTFDCPDASVAAPQRPASNTPLQALTLLNSQTCLEAARGLAARLLSQGLQKDEDIARVAFRSCLTRPPSDAEVSRLADVLRAHRIWYESHPSDAEAMADGIECAGRTLAEGAALTAIANVIMNLDEFITRE